jgi:hypothetical protein
MIEFNALRRLDESNILPELRQTLAGYIAEDAPSAVHVQWGGAIPLIFKAVTDTDEQVIQPFASAWSILAAFLERLDHLEDGDTDVLSVTTASPVKLMGIHYNRVIGYFFLATGILDLLDYQRIPERRIHRLRRYWSDCLLRAVSGQQCDLESQLALQDDCRLEGRAALEAYQRATQAKAGPIFALAFGGTAILATDDDVIINALMLAGEAYGTLLQYGDDVSDVDSEGDSMLTLPKAYSAARGVQGLPDTHELNSYWNVIYTAYIQQVERTLTQVPIAVQESMRSIFRQTFECRQATENTQ